MKIRALLASLVIMLGGVWILGAMEPPPAGLTLGEPAPNFTLKSIEGKDVELASFKGKYVVLEWTNYECPFVKKHYDSGNMQALQSKNISEGVIWLSINSSAEGKQGNFAPEKWKELAVEKKAAPTAILLDPDGKVGKLYMARTTPEMFVIDPEGNLLYMGAIDDKSGRDLEEVKTAKNHVQAALDEARAGKPVSVPITRSYGCSVKY
ncbi:MAG: thioredoxin family protein [Candidatus Rifleibacteriota bacterium]